MIRRFKAKLFGIQKANKQPNTAKEKRAKKPDIIEQLLNEEVFVPKNIG